MSSVWNQNFRRIAIAGESTGHIAVTTPCTQGHAYNKLFELSALIGQCLNSWRVTF